MIISSAAVFRYVLPLKYSLPLKGCSLDNREGLIVEFKTAQNNYLYGEAAPLPDFSRESLFEVEGALVSAAKALLNNQSIPADLPASVAFAVESALDSNLTKACDNELKVAPLLIGSQSDIIQRLTSWKGDWPAEFKFKVGRQSVELDIDATRQILKILPETVRLRLDANQQWSFNQTLNYAKAIPINRVSYIEEPMITACRNEELYRLSGLGYALDETLQSPDYSYCNSEGLKALVIKPTLVGGLSRYQGWINQAQKDGHRIVFSSTFESHLGVDLIRRLACQLASDELHGFDTLSAFAYPLCFGLPDQRQRLPQEILNSMEQIWCSNIAR
ncbi:o-succinylbenzoate synthase [Endozoicomonas sp. OPT23]|uniref:o-succinylbenzoate synthase n=1 Tax=Endozoicomonas sp. OPT23 TaxID=2072845 RepID=UPI001891548C|nr:o-succinylbenzoate synthase [Endozoicomonas sp. OPT23]